MRLYIVRHGIAHDVGEQGIKRDKDRTLTDEGRERVALAAKGLAAIGVAPNRIATSPLPRAEETARAIWETLGGKAEFEVCEFLEPGAAVRDVLDWLGRHKPESAMIVGHMPDVATITDELVCEDGVLSLTFRKAATACVLFEYEPDVHEGELEWLLQPRILRTLAKAL